MKRLLSLGISLAILALIYWKIDFRKLIPVFAQSDPLRMAAALGMVVPLTLLTSWRFQQLAPREARIGFGEANRLILSASVLNLVLPSKMGDIAKAFFLPMRRSLALSLVVFEKACDMLSLLVWCLFGIGWVVLAGPEARSGFDPVTWSRQLGIGPPPAWARMEWVLILCTIAVAGGLLLGALLLGSRRFAPWFLGSLARIAKGRAGEKFGRLRASWLEMQDYCFGSRKRFVSVAATSLLIWLLHLLQIWLFILALRAWCPFLANLALSPLAILAGLLPLTFAGVGTRDAALVLLYAAYFDAPTAAALGLLCTARYVLPAIGGIPFFHRYLAALRTAQPK